MEVDVEGRGGFMAAVGHMKTPTPIDDLWKVYKSNYKGMYACMDVGWWVESKNDTYLMGPYRPLIIGNVRGEDFGNVLMEEQFYFVCS